MLCYRCGSHTPDGSRKCEVCGEPFSERRLSGSVMRMAKSASGRSIALPYAVGDIVGERYRIEEAIAQGAAGWVFRARDEEVDIMVALKVIAAKLLQTHEDRNRFVKAMERARKMHHANIVRIYDEGIDGKHNFYTMPHLEGLSLRRIIELRLEKGQVFSTDETLPLIEQMGAAVDAIGKSGAHGGLRPSSVLVLPDVLKVTGVAHFAGLPRQPFMAQQSDAAYYFAPEARSGETTDVSRRADVFSLAVICGQMLSGQLYGRDLSSWSEADALVPDLVKALTIATDPHAKRRFSTAKALLDALAAAVQKAGSRPLVPLPAEESLEVDMDFDRDVDFDTAPETAADILHADDAEVVPVGRGHAGDAARRAGPMLEEDTIREQPLLERQKARCSRKKPSSRPSLAIVMLAGTIVVGAILFSIAMFLGSSGTAPSAAAESDTDPREQSTTAQVAEEEAEEEAQDSIAGGPQGKDEAKAAVAAEDSVGAIAPGTADTNAQLRADRNLGGAVDAAEQAVGPASKPLPESPAPAPFGNAARETPQAQATPAVPSPVKPEPPACPGAMAKIDAGSFFRGSQSADNMRGFGDLGWASTNTGAYCIDIYEYPNKKGVTPTVNVVWSKAKKLCARDGKRLCDETEWERACKGPANLRFPANNNSAAGCNTGGGNLGSAGTFGRCKSGYGVFDMAGNAAEWTSSRWSASIPDRVVRGGSVEQAAYTARCAARGNQSSAARNAQLGFRCCISL